MFFVYWDVYQNIISIFFSFNNFWLTLYFTWYYPTTQCLFSLLFAWNIFSHPFIFNLSVPLDIKWLSCSTILLNQVFFNAFFQSFFNPFIFEEINSKVFVTLLFVLYIFIDYFVSHFLHYYLLFCVVAFFG